MQLTLAFLELEPLSPPQTSRQDVETTDEARKSAIEIMARILAQSLEATEPTEGCNE
jgi:hypothetical protein